MEETNNEIDPINDTLADFNVVMDAVEELFYERWDRANVEDLFETVLPILRKYDKCKE